MIASPSRLAFLFLGLAGFAVLSPIQGEPARPNILYFYVDDMGWGSIGPNGQAERRASGLPTVKTPNLDQLAAEGVNFTRAYGCTVCSPARSSQQTGYHQGHTFADRNDPDNAKKAMRAEDVTMGDVLSEAGYVTAYWGKWGYGGSKEQEDPTLDNLQTLPTSHGYQHVLAELHHVRAHTFFQPTLWSAPAPKGSRGGLQLIPNTLRPFVGDERYPPQPSNHHHPQYPEIAYCDDFYAFAALDFVKEQGMNYRETGQPFFGLLAVQVPHAPFGEVATLPGWNEAYVDDPHFEKLAAQSQQWAAMVTRIDAHFGNLLAALEDPDGDGDKADSIKDDTLVIFMSDNGGPGGKNNVELDANAGLRGNKGSIYEGGIRVPTVLRWPSRITTDTDLAAGSSSDRVIDVSDLLPTFCDLAGAEIPVGLDGVSLAPLLTGEGEQRSREFLIHEAGKRKSIIRGKDKLVLTSKGKGLELYDLESDRSETTNLAKEKRKLVKELETLLLGERVDEPQGFSNTYHSWTGADGAETSNPDHWSDYVYANAGITYQEERGAPQLSWTAVMGNSGSEPAVARGNADLEFLGLELRGNPEVEKATQELALGDGINLTGRNEVRVSRGGILTLDGGEVSSLRWIDVKEGGRLRGKGSIEGTLYQSGTVEISVRPKSDERLRVAGDYRPTRSARLSIPLRETDEAPMAVSGTAYLAGKLELIETEPGKLRVGDRILLLGAARVQGRFDLPDDEILTGEGTRLRLVYESDGVMAVVLEDNELPST